MAELDKFTILFNSESLKEFEQELKKSEQSLDTAEKQVKKLEDELKKLEEAENKDTKAIAKTKAALEEAKNTAENFKKTVTNMKNSTNGSLLQLRDNFLKLSKAVGALAFVGLTIRKSLNFYEQGEQLEFLAEKTGIAVEKLQQLGNAAKKYGGTTEGTAGTIENLRQSYQDAKMGNASGGVKQAYLKYGFQISSDPEKTLERLAAKMETMKSDTAKWDLAKNLGIDEGTTRLLIQGQAKYNEELKKANKYKLYTKEDIQRMRDYRQISQDIRMGIESIAAIVYRQILPYITNLARVLSKIIDWGKSHSGLVEATAAFITFLGVIKALSIAFNIFGLSAIKTGGSIKKGAAIAKTGMASFLGWAAVITAIYLVIDDFVGFLHGKESFIGDFWKKRGHDLDEIRRGCEIWGDRMLRWARNFMHALKGELDLWEHDKKDISIVKDLTLAEQRKVQVKEIQDEAKKHPQQQISEYKMSPMEKMTRSVQNLMKGKKQLETANNNKLNSVSQNTISQSYQKTEQNKNDNSKNQKNISNKITNINEVNINVTSSDPEISGRAAMQTATQLDNGQLA